jgi:hypothetical protein
MATALNVRREIEFPPVLRLQLWHTTPPERFEQIPKTGAILPNPPIADTLRWKASRGPHYYSYVRTLGDVSLFDFEGFDAERYSAECPMSSWREFVPYSRTWRSSIWIEIDRSAIASNLLTAKELAERQNRDNAHRHTLMPRIEVAHLGPIQVSKFRRAFICGVDQPSFKEIKIEV